MSDLQVLEWTYKLQYEMDQMDSKELNAFLAGKAIKYEGKLYTLGEENEQGKNNKVKSKTTRAVKRVDSKSSLDGTIKN
jgi:hypothetical protein